MSRAFYDSRVIYENLDIALENLEFLQKKLNESGEFLSVGYILETVSDTASLLEEVRENLSNHMK